MCPAPLSILLWILDWVGNQLITEGRLTILRERSYGIKGKPDSSEKDLLILSIRVDLEGADDMNNSDVRACKVTLIPTQK